MPNQVHSTPRIRNHHQIPDTSRTPARMVSRMVPEGVASLVIPGPLCPPLLPVPSAVHSTSADTSSDQPLSEWPAGRDIDRTSAQRTAAVGLTDRGSLVEFALMADRHCGLPMTVVRELGGPRLASLGARARQASLHRRCGGIPGSRWIWHGEGSGGYEPGSSAGPEPWVGAALVPAGPAGDCAAVIAWMALVSSKIWLDRWSSSSFWCSSSRTVCHWWSASTWRFSSARV